MDDTKNSEDSCLFKLSQYDGLEWFKHLVLVSSYQDQYAPFDSARIQICKEATQDRSKGNIYIQMVNSMLSELPLQVLYRIDVNFNI